MRKKVAYKPRMSIHDVSIMHPDHHMKGVDWGLKSSIRNLRYLQSKQNINGLNFLRYLNTVSPNDSLGVTTIINFLNFRGT